MQIRSFALRYSSANHRVMTLAFFFICCVSLVGFSLAANRASVKRDIGRAFAPIVVSGDPAHNDVALTFDDGPNPDATPQILRELEHAHTHATFFVVGRLAERYPQLIAHMVRDGDAIENHSWAHEYTVIELPSAFRHALEHADRVIEDAGAEHPRYFRPPYGVHAPWTLEQARADGENVVLWSVPLSDDWDQPGTQVIVQRTLAYVKPGAIMVLHDGNEGEMCAGTSDCDRRQEIAATPIIIRALLRRALHPVTIPELLEGSPKRIADRRR